MKKLEKAELGDATVRTWREVAGDVGVPVAVTATAPRD